MTPTANSASSISAQPAQLSAIAAAGLHVLASEPAASFTGTPTTRYTLALPESAAKTLPLELSQSFDAASPEFASQLSSFLVDTTKRLRSPLPNAFLSLSGLPLSYTQFGWPFHESSAGADTSLVHGQINLEDGNLSPLHAKIAAAMTVTFREIVRAPEQPFAESFILNAIRKTLDQGQLELVKSGNRQPVPVTTRYFSTRQSKFIFNDTTEAQRRAFLAAKTFWLSGILGVSSDRQYAPVWLLDPRDAQYLNTTVSDLKLSIDALVTDGLIVLSQDPIHASEFASPTTSLMQKNSDYLTHMADALAFIKPSFNESMRGGHTNM